MPENNLPNCEIGVFGGSGFYSLLVDAQEIEVATPFGEPSDKITVGEIAGKKIAFLPRHGVGHRFSPSTIPYKANLWAFKELGVSRIIAPTAAGSLQPHIKPGDFVICDQFVDMTKGRDVSYYSGPKVVHVSCADPYCPELRQLAIKSCRELKISTHEKGTVVVIEGPRFSTKAESRWYQKAGFEVINMTQCPEAILARELEICYVNISLITDWDAGLIGDAGVNPVSTAEVIEIFNKNNEKLKGALNEIIKLIPAERSCECGHALMGAAM